MATPPTPPLTVPPSPSMPLDPEEEAFLALRRAVAAICRKQGVDSAADPRLRTIVAKYKDRYPDLTAESIEEELKREREAEEEDEDRRGRKGRRSEGKGKKEGSKKKRDDDDWESAITARHKAPISSLDLIADLQSVAASALTQTTAAHGWGEEEDDDDGSGAEDRGAVDEERGAAAGSGAASRGGDSTGTPGRVNESMEMDLREISGMTSNGDADGGAAKKSDGSEEENERGADDPEGWCPAFHKSRRKNGGFNLLTYAFFLSALAALMFLISVLLTYLDYNRTPYRDWALAGGVTPTTASFRVRGPSSDDGKVREFVVSRNPNLALYRHHILTVPVSHRDYGPEEHFVKSVKMENLTPGNTYYYGITRPRHSANSAVVAGTVGTFSTPRPEGERMDFTIATGSCALTGSKASTFAKVLDLDPLLFVHTGDFHYEDQNTLDVDERLTAYDKVMGSPSQRLLYSRTIFAYMWDDHDWLGNDEDGNNYEEAALAARRGYSLGIPHYDLGSKSSDPASAAKYQAFTIGTVRFVITDLRSESIRSSEYYGGRIYGKEQKEWLFDEFRRAADYDYVVWASTRPWTSAPEVGSDGWGGFVSDRDELSAHIAATIGAGPRNLLAISGDTHMIAFDDGSNTDYSKQEMHPGGFPLLHSGPLAQYGGSPLDFFAPEAHAFTDGCAAYTSAVNHQFSTVSFRFPYDDGEGCVLIRSYAEDSSTVVFEKEMCGELMKYGDPGAGGTCRLERLPYATQYVFVAAAGLILVAGLATALFLKWTRALGFFGVGVLYSLLTVAASVAGAYCFGQLGVNIFAVSVFVLVQAVLGSLFVGRAAWGYCKADDEGESAKADSGDEIEAGAKAIGKGGGDVDAAEEDGAGTYSDNSDGPAGEGGEASMVKELHDTSSDFLLVKRFETRQEDNTPPETVEASAPASEQKHNFADFSARTTSSAGSRNSAIVGSFLEDMEDESSIGAVLCGGGNDETFPKVDEKAEAAVSGRNSSPSLPEIDEEKPPSSKSSEALGTLTIREVDDGSAVAPKKKMWSGMFAKRSTSDDETDDKESTAAASKSSEGSAMLPIPEVDDGTRASLQEKDPTKAIIAEAMAMLPIPEVDDGTAAASQASESPKKKMWQGKLFAKRSTSCDPIMFESSKGSTSCDPIMCTPSIPSTPRSQVNRSRSCHEVEIATPRATPKSEGIEMTNPTAQLGSSYNIRVSPSLMSL
ncbi:hypothetical protein ACHAWF_014464 [Thalassiosira exigua]